MKFEFSKEDMVEMAKFVAQLVREGVRFEVSSLPGVDTWVIHLTGVLQ
jgi:hypothetical protein